MCTAVSFRNRGFYFGRTLDNDASYGEEVVVAPRSFKLWRGGGEHYAIIGMAAVADGLPLYYDGMNEKGLCMAGLNFIGNARYGKEKAGAVNVAQYEFLPYILGTCGNVGEAERALESLNITDRPFRPDMPPAALHWMISDGARDIVIECTASGTNVFENPVGVLTNNPPFGMQLFNLNNYMSLSSGEPVNAFGRGVELTTYCKGMGALGLPGDFSSQSRFVRAAFLRNNYSPDKDESGDNALFNILGGVNVPRGCCRSGKGWEVTLYTSCMDAEKGVYSYFTHADRAVKSTGFDGIFEGCELRRSAGIF